MTAALINMFRKTLTTTVFPTFYRAGWYNVIVSYEKYTYTQTT